MGIPRQYLRAAVNSAARRCKPSAGEGMTDSQLPAMGCHPCRFSGLTLLGETVEEGLVKKVDFKASSPLRHPNEGFCVNCFTLLERNVLQDRLWQASLSSI